jgi:integrase
MDTHNLKLRHRTWFARVSVPRNLRPLLGKSEVLRSLKTRDLAEARRRRHRVVASINEELSRLAVSATLPKGSVEYVVDVAREQRQTVIDGMQDERAAEAGLDVAVEDYLERQRGEKGFDPHTGDPVLSEAEERALQLAHKVFRGEEMSLLSEQVKKYLKEVQPRITKAGYAQKEKQLNAFARWAGADVEVSTITRKITGRYVADVVQTAELAAKTKKDWIANLTAFGSWLEQYGIIEANPWRNLTRAIRESTRGGKPEPRPYTTEEFAQLVQKLTPGGPLLPLACISAYSGLRIEEIAAMKAEHVTDTALRVMDAKNPNSVRYVPIHPVIAPMVARLLETTNDGHLITGLLPGGADGKRSHYASKYFGDFLRSNGFADTTLNFHSLRRSFAQRCEQAAVPESTAQLLMGHARQSLTYGLYSPGPEFNSLVAAVAKVTYGPTADALVASLAATAAVTQRSRRRPTRGRAEVNGRHR